MKSEDMASDSDLMSASWIFEQVALHEQQKVDRSRIRRAVDEGAETYFETTEGGWCRWIVETGNSLGRTSRAIDAELDELIRLAADGLIVVIRSQDGQTWHSFTMNRFRSIWLGSPLGGQPIRVVSPKKLSRILRNDGFQGRMRAVVIQPSKFGVTDKLNHEPGVSPLARVFSLLRAERTDVWVVVAFALVSGLLGIATPLAVEALVNTVAFGRFLQPVIILSLMLLAFLLFQAALKALQTFVVEIIQRRLFARLAADLSFRLPHTTAEAFHGHYAPELVNRFFDVVTVQKIVSQLLLDGLSIVLSAFVGMAVLAFYHPYLLAFDIVLILLVLFTMFVLGRGAVKTSIKESKTKYAMAAWLEDLARCRTSFRYDGAADFALERSNLLIHDYLTARKKHFRVLIRQIVFMLLVQALASTALLAIGGWLVITMQLSLGQLVAAELIVAIVVGSFAKLGKHIESFYDLLASMDKLGTLLDLPLERADGLLAAPTGGAVQMTDVSYSLPGGTSVLKKLSLEIPNGRHVAVCGDSGSGKSVLLDLIFGLRYPDSGRVTVDGIEPRDLRPDVLRRGITLVRDTEVFDGTIAENVHLERPNICMADVREALEIVGLMPLIQRFPDGLETKLAQSGEPLTASQQRRLMVARAVVGQPDIILIDALLDGLKNSEAENVLGNILKAREKQTIFLVTCRENLQAMMQELITLGSESQNS